MGSFAVQRTFCPREVVPACQIRKENHTEALLPETERLPPPPLPPPPLPSQSTGIREDAVSWGAQTTLSVEVWGMCNLHCYGSRTAPSSSSTVDQPCLDPQSTFARNWVVRRRSSAVLHSLLVVDSSCSHNWCLCCRQMEQPCRVWWTVCSSSLQSHQFKIERVLY